MVRMGELAVSTGPGDVLTSIGLGSCIGLALVDVDAHVAGLAHVMLPVSPEAGDPALGKFADTAAPALLEAVLAAGARRTRLSTFLVGGAQMFSFGGRGMDVGARNDQAVRDAVAQLRLRIDASETGGTKGRTIRVWTADGRVTVKEAGGAETPIAAGGPGATGSPAPTRSGTVDRVGGADRTGGTDRTGDADRTRPGPRVGGDRAGGAGLRGAGDRPGAGHPAVDRTRSADRSGLPDRRPAAERAVAAAGRGGAGAGRRRARRAPRGPRPGPAAGRSRSRPRRGPRVRPPRGGRSRGRPTRRRRRASD
ncbi:chemotaxis protein CheD [Patulibacter minatonensis]|uniref:chemotaxis protein CheD n=1 Tax=Patulibacter minatonensis TaxID=298163 RepID=UPI003CCC2F9A